MKYEPRSFRISPALWSQLQAAQERRQAEVPYRKVTLTEVVADLLAAGLASMDAARKVGGAA